MDNNRLDGSSNKGARRRENIAQRNQITTAPVTHGPHIVFIYNKIYKYKSGELWFLLGNSANSGPPAQYFLDSSFEANKMCTPWCYLTLRVPLKTHNAQPFGAHK